MKKILIFISILFFNHLYSQESHRDYELIIENTKTIAAKCNTNNKDESIIKTLLILVNIEKDGGPKYWYPYRAKFIRQGKDYEDKMLEFYDFIIDVDLNDIYICFVFENLDIVKNIKNSKEENEYVPMVDRR